LRIAAKKKKKAATQKLAVSRCALAPNIEKLKNKTCFKIGIASRVRGVVGCNNCMKPRCIYSFSAISNMKAPLPSPGGDVVSTGATSQECISLVKDRLHDAMESSIFICGMAPLDPDDPCYGIFLCDTTLDCDTHVEAEFYVSGIEPSRKELCCHCAGACDSPIELNSSLKAPIGPYSVVLPICKACLDDGYNIIVRAARQNTNAKQARMELENARVLAREEAATADIIDEEIAAKIFGSDEAAVPVPIASTNKSGRKTRYAKCVDFHTHVCFFIACSDDIVYKRAHS
jgi:hypothetical protein